MKHLASGYRRAIGVAAVISAVLLTPDARAEATEPVPEAPSATPLALRPSHPLQPAATSDMQGAGWKLGAFAAAGLVLVFGLRRAKAGRASDAPAPELRILRRASLGVRSELIVVEMDGQRLLLGVTPHAIQNLFIAPMDEAPEPADVPVQSARAPLHLAEEEPQARPLAARASDPRPRRPPVDVIEEQALGIRRAAAS